MEREPHFLGVSFRLELPSTWSWGQWGLAGHGSSATDSLFSQFSRLSWINFFFLMFYMALGQFLEMVNIFRKYFSSVMIVSLGNGSSELFMWPFWKWSLWLLFYQCSLKVFINVKKISSWKYALKNWDRYTIPTVNEDACTVVRVLVGIRWSTQKRTETVVLY